MLAAFLLCFLLSFRGGAFAPLHMALSRQLSGSNTGVGSGIALPQQCTQLKANDDIEEDFGFQFIQEYYEGREEVVEDNEVIVEALCEVYGKREKWIAEDMYDMGLPDMNTPRDYLAGWQVNTWCTPQLIRLLLLDLLAGTLRESSSGSSSSSSSTRSLVCCSFERRTTTKIHTTIQ